MNSKDKLGRLVDLPSLPALLMDALQHTADSQNIIYLTDKIGQDPPMVVRILRIANSPFYGMHREVGSLREAIVLLGLHRVRNMLLSVCFSKILPMQNKDFDYSSFWHHSMAVADCAHRLGMHTDIGPDLAFTAGLLHDIGRLVIVLLFPDEYSRIIESSLPDDLETERRILGFDHAEIGSVVAQHWNLPLAIQEAIKQHETSPANGAAITQGLLVYTANLLIKEAEQNSDSDSEPQRAITDALELLNVPIDQAIQLADISRQFADQIVATL